MRRHRNHSGRRCDPAPTTAAAQAWDQAGGSTTVGRRTVDSLPVSPEGYHGWIPPSDGPRWRWLDKVLQLLGE